MSGWRGRPPLIGIGRGAGAIGAETHWPATAPAVSVPGRDKLPIGQLLVWSWRVALLGLTLFTALSRFDAHYVPRELFTREMELTRELVRSEVRRLEHRMELVPSFGMLAPQKEEPGRAFSSFPPARLPDGASRHRAESVVGFEPLVHVDHGEDVLLGQGL